MSGTNLDGHADLTDLSAILNDFGSATPNASSASAPIGTPEPASLCLLFSSLLLAPKRRLFRRISH